MLAESVDLFEGMSPEFMNDLDRHLVAERLGPGDFLYRQGEPAHFLYILAEGRVRVVLGEQGHIAHVANCPGETMGWSSLVEQERHTTSAECLMPCQVKKIAREKLEEIFDRHPSSGLEFYRRLSKLLRRQLLDTYSLIPAAHGEKRSAPGF